MKSSIEPMLLKKIVSVLVLLGIIIMMVPTILFADLENAYVLGSNLGLVITTDPNLVESDNLLPGEYVTSSMILENNGAAPFEVYFKTNIKQGSEASPHGGNLADRLLLEIKYGNQVLVEQMPFREAVAMTQIKIGQMAVGSKLTLDFEVYFPESAGNDYQGATFQAYWTFVTVGNNTPTEPTTATEPTTGTEPTIGTEPTSSTEPTTAVIQATTTMETVTIEAEEVPLGEAEVISGEAVTTDSVDESLEEIFEEEIPLAVALPKTGQSPVIYFWLVGLLLISAGVWLKNQVH